MGQEELGAIRIQSWPNWFEREIAVSIAKFC